MSNASDFIGFITQARKQFSNRIYTDYLRRYAYGIDASCYRYVPRAVVRAEDESDIRALFALSNHYHIPLTFRAAGTSLSGQACSDFVLVLIHGAHWRHIHICHDDSGEAKSIMCGVGVIGAEANAALKPYGKKIGPDPATINHAMIGGIFSNNSSGMCCGVKQNSYQTIRSVRIMLHDGSVIDTSAHAAKEESIAAFLKHHSNKAQALLALREEILQDSALSALIAHKFAIKNTVGYGINSLLDFSNLTDILNHIFIGAEGTLGFVSRVEYECVEDYKYKACALLFYKHLAHAARAVEILCEYEHIVSAAEIMDYACLLSAKQLQDAPKELVDVPKGACALLIQLESNEQSTLKAHTHIITQALSTIPSVMGVVFSSDEEQINTWWNMRKSLLPLASRARPSGSVVITEDICFPMKHFAKGIEAITELFLQFDFEGIIFGHALSGNVHFIITPMLSLKHEQERFGAFMEAMVERVLMLEGSTKAEHGTGRMIAPFVEQEWGEKAYSIHRRIKQIFDSKNLINPDVIITDNPSLHTQNLKESYSIDEELNACMECGFCEKTCPSAMLTLSPRQRIAIQKELARLQDLQTKHLLSAQEQRDLRELERDYRYCVISTCATCQICSLSCPLDIDTAYIANTALSYTPLKKPPHIARFNQASSASSINTHTKHALSLPKHMKQKRILTPILTRLSSAYMPKVLYLSGILLNIANVFARITSKRTRLWLHRYIHLPYIPNHIPKANAYYRHVAINTNNFMESLSLHHASSHAAHIKEGEHIAAIYLSSCINRTCAPSPTLPNARSLQEVFASICKKAHIPIITPSKDMYLCCGKAYKAYPTLVASHHNSLHHALESSLNKARHAGLKPYIICDHSACSYELKQIYKHHQADIIPMDMTEFIAQVLLPRLHITPSNISIALHVMCATRKGKWEHALRFIARQCVTGSIIEHEQTQCCGFAGYKGFLTPELNASALSGLSAYIKWHVDKTDALCYGFSSSSTCEIGLNEHTALQWQHIAYLVDSVSSKKQEV